LGILSSVRSLGSAGIALALGLGLAAVWSWQWFDYVRHFEEHSREFDRYGEAILSAADLAVYRECRGGMYEPDELTASLEGVRRGIGSLGIYVRDSTGEIVAEVGEWQGGSPDAHLFEAEFEAPTPRGGGGRRGGGRRFDATGLIPLASGLLRIGILHPRDELDRKLAGDLRRLVITGTSLSLALALLAIVLSMRLRALGLSARLEGANERVRALEYLGRLGAGLVHETRNPLGVVRGHAQRIADGSVPADDVAQTARTILDETDRTLTRLDEFLLLSRPSEPNRTRFGARGLVLDLIELVTPDSEDRGATISLRGGDFELHADYDQARRLLLNLILNALQSLDEGGEVRVELEELSRRHEIRVIDEGHGIPDEIRETIFEPYVTRREGGTGLGLSIARRIADEHGWRLRFEANRPRGTVMIIEVPKR